MSEFFELAVKYLPSLLQAALQYTIPLTIMSFSLGLVFALVTALIRLSQSPKNEWAAAFLKILKGFAAFYVWTFRSTPLIVQLFIVFYGLPNAHISFFANAWVSAITVFSLNTGAYASETIRAAILSVPHVQKEAGLSLGMSNWEVYLYVVLPQAARISIPPLSNSLISLLKDTSLASVITIVEMFYLSQQIAAQNYRILSMYILVAIVYAFLTSILSIGQHYLEIYTSRFAQ
ncbi:amino acid ABC transporter permease [Convivina intestini]|uniref:Amino acid ABC transporter membrane protein (PAAT family) n=1 Tax=Convivina intestini TaxID=1505726 RepID=A0A2U1D7S8_9LACO|nr:amino acid ABC transporter permease [Convivina intestini]PVY83728.1 amino acid ABC transporter membrane protein (PAAT family) [Convivina intestini]CAH1853341.1 L-cystine transport system permease protein TcyB [Convivina intestini]CAH1855050.1 L-cystine transport system permease protein TcyB [Convivina intestini]SDB92491.1 cystine transport system permease protein [Leuconostocaceae bacterium R-53105]